jgi:hypothetical protein
MVLRCPKCGSKRVIFLSTTDGTAVGSTDQRYWCKDCDYRGSLILDDSKRSQGAGSRGLMKLLVLLDIALFPLVLAFAVLGSLPSTPGLAVLFSWVAVFLATIIFFTVELSRGMEEWYKYGMQITSGVIVATVIGLILVLELIWIIILIPFCVLGVLAISWLTIDFSEEEMGRDLKRLRGEIH